MVIEDVSEVAEICCVEGAITCAPRCFDPLPFFTGKLVALLVNADCCPLEVDPMPEVASGGVEDSSLASVSAFAALFFWSCWTAVFRVSSAHLGRAMERHGGSRVKYRRYAYNCEWSKH